LESNMLTTAHLATLNDQFAAAHPIDIIRWARDAFGASAAASSSFQTQSVPLLHMISRAAGGMRIFFLDTGFHFDETLRFKDELALRYGLNVVSLFPALGHASFRAAHGELHRVDADRCCHLNKVEPLERARRGCAAWISGIRRDQTPNRRQTQFVAQLPDGTIKICPLAAWTDVDVRRYAAEQQLPEHPLDALGYASIGCAPCTRPVAPGDDKRAGRWQGTDKVECGLHLPAAQQTTTAAAVTRDGVR
jgi:phosphoadenosine phosphosulfate reductase